MMTAGAPFKEAVSVALGSLRSNKMRSLLTLLGVILATATLIAVMSIIHGMDVYIAEQVSSMGTDGFRIRRVATLGQADPKKLLELLRKNPELSLEEFTFIKEHATLVRELGLEVSRNVPVRLGNEEAKDVSLQGATANLAVINGIQPDVGRFLVDAEDRKRASVVFIGNDLRDRFFGGLDPTGKTLFLQGRPFTVIGAAKKQGSVFGQSRDNFVIIPVQTYFKMFGSRRGLGYTALALDRDHLNAARDEMRMLIRAYRHVPPNDEDNFGMFGSDSLVEVWDRLTGVIAATAMAVVSVFMVVGGVVIMNIMLAVVTERTHEIGIRKSVGATRRDILSQFLVESSVLSATGGLLGVMVAWAVALLVRAVTPVPMELPLTSVVVGVGLSAMVGLFFGVYPARRAAELDPIAALRFEV